MTALESFILATLIFASAFMAASEIALFSLSKFQIRLFKDRDRPHHRRIKKLLSDPGGLLITVLVVNEVLNVAIATIITRGASRSIPLDEFAIFRLPAWSLRTLIGSAISAPIVLFVCDITPKAIAARVNQLVASLTVNTVSLVYDVLKPVRIVLKKVVASVSRWSGKTEPTVDAHEMLRESDFLLMVEEGHKEGAVQASEVELIKNVFELDDTTVSDVFTPLVQVKSLSANTSVRDALVAIRALRYSRIPITGANRRDVVGILYSKDLLRARLEPERLALPISELMLDPVYVLPKMKLNALFRRLKQQRIHMAIVQQRAGEALGVITLSDVMDTLFGDLFPEDDQ